MYEIEKKYLPRITIPEIPVIQKKNPVSRLKQAYTVNTPHYSVRIRSVENSSGIKYYKTIKKGQGLSRVEHEVQIQKDIFDMLSGKSDKWIEKLRYTFDYIYEDESRIECTLDSFQNEELDNLFLIEVEFETEDQANEFNPPYWFGEDVTLSSKYINANLIKKLK